MFQTTPLMKVLPTKWIKTPSALVIGINPSVFMHYHCFQQQCHCAFHISNCGSNDRSTEVIIFGFLNLEVVNVCDCCNTFIKVFLKKPRRARSYNWCTCLCPISSLRKWHRKGFEDLNYQNQQQKNRKKGALCVCQKSIRFLVKKQHFFMASIPLLLSIWGVIITCTSLKLPSIVFKRNRSQEDQFRKLIYTFACAEIQTGTPSHFRSLH